MADVFIAEEIEDEEDCGHGATSRLIAVCSSPRKALSQCETDYGGPFYINECPEEAEALRCLEAGTTQTAQFKMWNGVTLIYRITRVVMNGALSR